MQAVSSVVHAAFAGNTAPAAALLAKLLGYGVVAGGAVLRVPQIVSIAQHGPSGLQPSMFEAELVGYSLCLAYSVHKGLAFSAYGEQAFVAIQTAVIVVLLYRAAPPPPLRAALLWGSYVAVLACYLAGARCCCFTTSPSLSLARSRSLSLSPPTCARRRARVRHRGWVRVLDAPVLGRARAAAPRKPRGQVHGVSLRRLHGAAGGRQRRAGVHYAAGARRAVHGCRLLRVPSPQRRHARPNRSLRVGQEGARVRPRAQAGGGRATEATRGNEREELLKNDE